MTDGAPNPGRAYIPRATRRFREGPQRVGSGVDRVLKHLNAPSADVVESVFTNWSGLVGEVIGTHTRPKTIDDGTLVLEVDNPAWASEMEWMSEDILSTIAERTETTEITAITVVIAKSSH